MKSILRSIVVYWYLQLFRFTLAHGKSHFSFVVSCGGQFLMLILRAVRRSGRDAIEGRHAHSEEVSYYGERDCANYFSHTSSVYRLVAARDLTFWTAAERKMWGHACDSTFSVISGFVLHHRIKIKFKYDNVYCIFSQFSLRTFISIFIFFIYLFFHLIVFFLLLLFYSLSVLTIANNHKYASYLLNSFVDKSIVSG